MCHMLICHSHAAVWVYKQYTLCNIGQYVLFFWDEICTVVLQVRFPRVSFLGWDFDCDFPEKYSSC